ncbi:RDD family protein [Paenibacillus koleovorans]|uniref:RDD family protein n=1 Tax=Paenibacillus koleovorans TaxID=121608 RepID=UPI000FD6BD00|nr:RDD family protein [Paenibacillus koleovorans]
MRISFENEVSIVTPEQVQLQFPTAGAGMRAVAHLLDLLILSVFYVALGFAYYLVWSNDYALAALLIIGAVGSVGYFVGCEYFMGGQTIGKRVVHIRVVQRDGRNAGLLAVLIRNLFRLIDLLPMCYFLGLLVVLGSSNDRRIGDMVAGTIVVVEKETERLKLRRKVDKQIDKWRDLLPQKELGAESRKAIAYADWMLLAAWAERLPFVTSDRIGELAYPIAQHFADKMGIARYVLAANDTVFLIWLYLELRGEWEV